MLKKRNKQAKNKEICKAIQHKFLDSNVRYKTVLYIRLRYNF